MDYWEYYESDARMYPDPPITRTVRTEPLSARAVRDYAEQPANTQQKGQSDE